MSDKKKFPLDQMRAVAIAIRDRLAPLCEKIEIAGSIRREKPEVSDIEILYIPRMENQKDGLFDWVAVSLVDEELDRWLAAGKISKRPSKTGAFTWGPKNKLAMHTGGIPIDFFATTAENWFVSLVIRTGSKDTNLALTTGAQKFGGSLEAYGAGVRNSDGSLSLACSEQDVFRLCGVEYLEPTQR